MKKNGKLSAALHALLHMAERPEPMTSETLALCLQTNPVVVRRTMAGLREAGLVASLRGHGGGWALARPLAAITLGDIYAALDEPVLVERHADPLPPQCLVQAAVSEALGGVYRDAEAMLRARLAQITLAQLYGDIQNRHSASIHLKEK